ncbi:DUF1294 domain-containing protein [bacterium]|nr:MAG: DUF1294 domain-containing protein [bacterium]
MTFFYIAVVLINLLAFAVIGSDKKRSINNGERVSEVNLFFVGHIFLALQGCCWACSLLDIRLKNSNLFLASLFCCCSK